jgi:Flp pilus assembly protein TadD
MRADAIHPFRPTASPKRPSPTDRALTALDRGVHAYSLGDVAAAQQHLRRAIALDLCNSEPWYWLGRIQEDLGEVQRAAQCLYLSRNSRLWEPARSALRRLGFLGRP